MRPRTVFLVVIALVSSASKLHSQIISLHHHDDAGPASLVDRGVPSLEEGKLADARRCFDTAIHIDPTMWPAYYNRARLFRREKQWEAAVQDLDMAIRLKPNFYVASTLRGDTFEHLGKYDRSLADYDRVLSLDSMDVTRAGALNGRAWLRATCPNAFFRNGGQALVDAKSACNITSWKQASYIDTLAAAYAEIGDFDSAARYEQQAIALDRKTKNLVGADQRLALFFRHQNVRAERN